MCHKLHSSWVSRLLTGAKDFTRVTMATIAIVFCWGSQTSAADLVHVLPVTDEILMVQFDEGHLDYMGIDEDRFSGIKIYANLLDVSAATDAGSYVLTSPDDSDYISGSNPVAVGRKSKGADFNNIYDAGEPQYLSDHYLFLVMPNSLKEGRTYTLSLTGLAENRKDWTWRFEYRRVRSETVRVNQLGYQPEARKIAYLSHWMGDLSHEAHQNGALSLDGREDTRFDLIDYQTGASVFQGTINKRKSKTEPDSEREGEFGPHRNYSRTDVWEADFTAYQEPGEYVVAVEGIGCSYPFEIGDDVYREAFYYASKGLFVQRSGVAKEVEPGWVLPRDQHPAMEGKNFYYDPNVQGNFEDASFKRDKPVEGIWGWYHDAGDWDGYISHSSVSALLLLLFELRHDRMVDGDLGHRVQYAPEEDWQDEGANGLPDLLDEAGWLIKCYRRARQALMDQGYGTGGVPGYFGIDVGYEEKPSWEDPRDLLIAGENIENTYNYAGLAAMYAVCLNLTAEGEHPDSAGWVEEAREAFQWADEQPGTTALFSRHYAAAALYRATGDPLYQNHFKAFGYRVVEPVWTTPRMAELGVIAYAMAPDDLNGLDTEKRAEVRETIITAADDYAVDYAEEKRGFRFGGARPRQTNLLGVFSTPKATFAAVSHHLTGDDRYLNSVRSTVDYFLGGNEMNMVWMTGVGENSEYSAFHLNSWYSVDFNSQVYRNPIATGLVPYGSYRDCDWFGCGWRWVGDEDFSRSTAYPAIADWPQAEARFQNRHNIPGSEFTVHQTMNHAIFATGYLVGHPTEPFRNERPTVRLPLEQGEEIARDSTYILHVNASEDTRRVVYYYDFHLLGESTNKADQFAYEWDVNQTTLQDGATPVITAVAYDDRGLISWPSPDAEKQVSIVATKELSQAEGFLQRDGFELGFDWYRSRMLGNLFLYPETNQWAFLETLNSFAWFPPATVLSSEEGSWLYLMDANGLDANTGSPGQPMMWAFTIADYWNLAYGVRQGWIYLTEPVEDYTGWWAFVGTDTSSYLVSGETQIRLR